jgi:hypothetical protein
MNQHILDHYRQFSTYTNPGLYKEKLLADLPSEVREIGKLIRTQCVHRVTLANGNTGSNADKRYGDMTQMPWWRQPEDDVLPTAAAMLAELYRRDPRGFTEDRAVEDKLVLTCRFVAILTASILKSKGKPARVRSGFDPYAAALGKSFDHWITQYWEENEQRWITIDVDCSLEDLQFDPYDMPEGVFDWSADAWLQIREGKVSPERFWNAGGYEGLMPVAWELYYDLHCLMNNEIIYLHTPSHVRIGNFEQLSEAELQNIDALARLMRKPDEHFDELRELWENDRQVRLLKGALL